ncbi:unnamed protein product [Lathyrus sativus]|nr:unnamed protein product [Lathyrus sativus]
MYILHERFQFNQSRRVKETIESGITRELLMQNFPLKDFSWGVAPPLQPKSPDGDPPSAESESLTCSQHTPVMRPWEDKTAFAFTCEVQPLLKEGLQSCQHKPFLYNCRSLNGCFVARETAF